MKILRASILLLLVINGLPPVYALDITWTPLPGSAGGAKGAVQLDSGEILATHERRQDEEHQVVCMRSDDNGETWRELSVIARETKRATLGDGHLLQLPTGEILFSYRHNLLGEKENDERDYAIRVAISQDHGLSWERHSIVASSSHDPDLEPRASRGLWSSFLWLTSDGKLHCVYDDEDTPHKMGFTRHQWLTMKTWDPEDEVWGNSVTVSRAFDPGHLSRDGMASVVELPSGRLLAAFETVQTTPPHANLIRFTTSDDGGKNWNWKREERGLIFESPDRPDSLSLSPWLAQLPTGELICVFATDEDRDTVGVSGTPPQQLNMDIKFVFSTDGGDNWSRPAQLVFGETHRNYMPGILPLQDGSLLVTFMDFSSDGHRAVRGRIPPSMPPSYGR